MSQLVYFDRRQLFYNKHFIIFCKRVVKALRTMWLYRITNFGEAA